MLLGNKYFFSLSLSLSLSLGNTGHIGKTGTTILIQGRVYGTYKLVFKTNVEPSAVEGKVGTWMVVLWEYQCALDRPIPCMMKLSGLLRIVVVVYQCWRDPMLRLDFSRNQSDWLCRRYVQRLYAPWYACSHQRLWLAKYNDKCLTEAKRPHMDEL